MSSLKFPDGVRCLIPGCQEKVTHQFSVRMRRKDTGADWAPNVPAYFCTLHANSGAEIKIVYEPNRSGKVEIETYAGRLGIAQRDYEIP